MSLTASFPFVATPPFYTGLASTSSVPHVFPLAINGRPYMVDQKSGQFVRGFEQRVRDSQDSSTAPGEAAINPGGLWRRGEVSWHRGAGQRYADVAESTDYRFYASKGVNPWNKGKLTLLNDTKLSLSSATTTQHLLINDGYVYASLDTAIKYTTDPFAASPTWTTCTGGPSATTVQAMATDGTTIYVGFTSDGVRTITPATAPGTISTAKFVNSTDSYYMLGFAKNFMFGAHDYKLRSISSGGSPADVIVPSDQSFRWVGVATGQGAVYAAGYAGKKSTVYKITLTDAGVLNAGIVALELPTGEVATAISGYLGFIIVGTNKGVRFCSPNGNGDLVAGSLIPTSGSVNKIASNDRFVYFTWSNYDGVSSGVGRMDLSQFISENTPAYATDVMYGSIADVTSLVISDNKSVFTISGVGVVVEDSTQLVSSGTIETGIYRWGIPDRKFIAKVDTRATPLVGSIVSQMALDDGTFTTLGTWDSTADTENTFSGSDTKTIEARFKFTLNRSATITAGPTLTRWTARAYAAPFRSEYFRIPVLLHKKIRVLNKDYFFDVSEELGSLRQLILDPTIVVFQLGDETFSVIMEDLEFTAADAAQPWLWEGTATVTMRSVQQ